MRRYLCVPLILALLLAVPASHAATSGGELAAPALDTGVADGDVGFGQEAPVDGALDPGPGFSIDPYEEATIVDPPVLSSGGEDPFADSTVDAASGVTVLAAADEEDEEEARRKRERAAADAANAAFGIAGVITGPFSAAGEKLFGLAGYKGPGDMMQAITDFMFDVSDKVTGPLRKAGKK